MVNTTVPLAEQIFNGYTGCVATCTALLSTVRKCLVYWELTGNAENIKTPFQQQQEGISW